MARAQDVDAVVAGRSVPFFSVDFTEAVAGPFLAAAGASEVSAVDRPVLVSALIPTELHNFHFRSFGVEGDVGSCMVHVEYRKDKVSLVAISQDR